MIDLNKKQSEVNVFYGSTGEKMIKYSDHQQFVAKVGNLIDHWEGLPNDIKNDPGMDACNQAMDYIIDYLEN